MTCSQRIFSLSIFLAALASAFAKAPAVQLRVSLANTNAIYHIGDTIKWLVTATDSEKFSVTNAAFRILRDNETVLRQGTLNFSNNVAEVETLAERPGTLLLEIKSNKAGGSNSPVFDGAMVEPQKIPHSVPRPVDFDEFWNRQLTELATVPPNPVLTPVTNSVKGVSRWLITMNLPHGQNMRGQLARPDKGEKFPAIIVFQWAGVYGLESWSVNNYAASGWLALNVMAHALPIDETPEFYKAQAAGPLKRYEMIGCEDREKSYFLRMFLACSRAVDYLASRPDWDGHTLVVTGTSQGGLQSIVAAALNPKVTAMMVLVPAGCDATATLANRGVPWPYWGEWMPEHQRALALRTAPYFDGVNFASRVKCPSLVGFGLLDRTATPAGVYLMTEELGGKTETILMPAATHKGDHAAFNSRLKDWLEALKLRQPVPASQNSQ